MIINDLFESAYAGNTERAVARNMNRPVVDEQGVAEMDKSQPSHGRDGKISHSTYGSRDKGGSTGPERTAKITTADRMMKHAHDVMMRSMSDSDKVKKGWRNPNMKEQGVAEGYSLGKVLTLPELLDQIKHILAAKHPGIGWRMTMPVENTFLFSAKNDYDVWSMLVVEPGGDDWVAVGHGMVDPDGKPIIFDRQQLPMTLASASEIADEAIQTYHDIDLSDYADDEDYNQGVAEGLGNIGSQIKAVYKKIYDAGDDAVEFAYYDSPIFAQYWDEYEGDLDSIIAEVDPSELQIIFDELTSAADDQGLAEADDNLKKKVSNFVNPNIGTVADLPVHAGLQRFQASTTPTGRHVPALSIGDKEGPYAQISPKGAVIGYRKTFESAGTIVKNLSAMINTATSRSDLRQIRKYVSENVRDIKAQQKIMEQATQIVSVRRRQHAAKAAK